MSNNKQILCRKQQNNSCWECEMMDGASCLVLGVGSQLVLLDAESAVAAAAVSGALWRVDDTLVLAVDVSTISPCQLPYSVTRIPTEAEQERAEHGNHQTRNHILRKYV